MKKITISVNDLQLPAELNDSMAAGTIWGALPLRGEASIWGDEIYFEVPLSIDLEPGAKEEVEVGTLGYWPPGRALCIFFGKTPLSTGDKPMAYSPVNVVGSVAGDCSVFKTVRPGDDVSIEHAR
jgi:hypothetical protein